MFKRRNSFLWVLLFPPREVPKHPGDFDTEELEWMKRIEGFYTDDEEANINLSEHPNITDDLQILEELLDDFWTYNHFATHYRSIYFRYQRIFLMGALLSTVISIVNAFIQNVEPFTYQLSIFDINKVHFSFVLSFCTALVSARATYYTMMANFGRPRNNWTRYRRLAEELRSLYHKYLAHTDSYQGSDRETNLRRRVFELKRMALSIGGTNE